MSFALGYLTTRQRDLWALRRSGLSEGRIADRLHISRQAVNKALTTIDAKVSRALTEAATINRLEITTIDSEKGILTGYSRDLKTRVIVTFSPKNGVQVWYKHQGDCNDCARLEECMRILLSEAEERGIQLSEDERLYPPSRLAEVMFERLMGG